VAFLTEACAGDASLQREVQALLEQPTEGLEGLTPSVIAHAIGNADSGGLTGRRFGVYLVGERIGVGGMGEVYRARDTRLRRDVAIKVLPQAFATDADRLARFEREARVLARLDHPHIGTILGVEESDGVRALVLGLVEGDTLAERIARGPIPLPRRSSTRDRSQTRSRPRTRRASSIVISKPSNIKITAAGVVKVLDFGLAKAEHLSASEGTRCDGDSNGQRHRPGHGRVYEPEQARGHAVDKRADIWAFGCVLYEMLTGRDAFARLTPSDTVAAILDRDPDLRALPDEHAARHRAPVEALLREGPASAGCVTSAKHGSKSTMPSTGRAVPTKALGRSFRWWLVATLLGVVLLGVAAAAFLVWTRVRPPAASASSAATLLRRSHALQMRSDQSHVGANRRFRSPHANGRGPFTRRDAPGVQRANRTAASSSICARCIDSRASPDSRNRQQQQPVLFSPTASGWGFWTGRVDAGEIGELKKLRLDGGPAGDAGEGPALRGATVGFGRNRLRTC
jgi:serine/threonine protein kinase